MPTALIVEDEPEANHLLAMIVQLRGYRTESAYTGTEALDKVRSQPPDLVFLDLMLPDINGYEVCKSLKARKATSLIPVIMVTAREAAENRRESFGIGADQYIPKPYTPDQIFEALTHASSWNHSVCGRTIAGVVPFDPAAEEESLRLFGQLRNVLVARTTLDHGEVNRIVDVLKEIWQDALSWGRQAHRRLEAALDYHVQPDRLAVTLRDTSGWLAHGRPGPEKSAPDRRAAAVFDEVIDEEPGHRMTFHKRYPHCDTPLPP